MENKNRKKTYRRTWRTRKETRDLRVKLMHIQIQRSSKLQQKERRGMEKNGKECNLCQGRRIHLWFESPSKDSEPLPPLGNAAWKLPPSLPPLLINSLPFAYQHTKMHYSILRGEWRTSVKDLGILNVPFWNAAWKLPPSLLVFYTPPHTTKQQCITLY